MKKMAIIAALLLTTLTATAQFERGTKYVGGNLSGLGFSYNHDTKFQFGLGADAGYFINDGWMFKGNMGYEHRYHMDSFSLTASARYYFVQNGIFLGAGLGYDHYMKHSDSVSLPIEVGYCFYLNHNVAIEPSVYYRPSFNQFSDCSTVGLRIGVGYFF